MDVKRPAKTDRSSRLAARYLDDQIVLSDSHCWTYLRIPTVPYEFLDYASREGIADRITSALSALITTPEPVDVHLLTTTRPFPVDLWSSALTERTTKWGAAPGWPLYMQQMAEHLNEEEFLRKEVYIGVCLGSRTGKGSPATEKMDLFGPLTKWVTKAQSGLELQDDYVTEAELAFWHRKATEVARSLTQSHIKATPVPASTVAWLITKPLYPEMECPAPTASPNRAWGPGEIQSLAEGVIENGRRIITVEQVDGMGAPQTGFTATLCLSRFPDVLHFPDQEPWVHFAQSLAFPVDVSIRLTVVPAMKVKKDIGRMLATAKDQAEHIAMSGNGIPLEVQEQLAVATAVEYTINKDRMPWAYSRPRIHVTAGTQDLLQARCQKIIEHYRDLSIDVVWPSGDQMDLLCEAMPGDKVRLKAYEQKQELALISGGMPTASAEVGDRIVGGRGWIGPYIGETTSRVRTMVSFSPHVAMVRNSPNGVAVTGSPGGGKSFFAFTLAYQMAMQGVWTIFIDPKADAKPMALLPGLGKPRLFDLANGNAGMLDPFSLGEGSSESTLLALETLRLLLGGEISEDREEALVLAIEQVNARPDPSLSKVVDVLITDENNTAARNLGYVLKTMRELPFARLCFAEKTGDGIRPEDGMTVITLLGLDLPAAGSDTSDYSYENRLAVAVMYLLTRFARRLMLSMDKSQPKAICIDEAWAITSTPQGAKLIPEIARMGRSHNTALVLVSQNAGDLMAESVTNCISTVFAFRSQNSTEIDNVLSLLNMEKNDAHHATVRDLSNGECLMKDVDGRIGRVQIDAWNAEMFQAFDTNPETRGNGAPGNPASPNAGRSSNGGL